MHLACVGVLFDCDGVLVDSDATVDATWRRWARDYGVDPEQLLATVHGRRSEDTVGAWVPAEQAAAALERIDRYEVEDAATVRALPGAQALLAAMPAGSWAIVTSGKRELAVARLRASGLPVPEVLVSAGDVTQGKPDPEGYARAARDLGVPAARTVVVEDAAAGMQAGRAAGVGHVLGVGGRAPEGEPDACVPDLRSVRWSGTGLAVTPA